MFPLLLAKEVGLRPRSLWAATWVDLHAIVPMTFRIWTFLPSSVSNGWSFLFDLLSSLPLIEVGYF
jgi:hypothetical protein